MKKQKTRTTQQEEIAEIPRDPATPKPETEAVLPHKVSEPEIGSVQPTPAPTLEEASTRIWGNAQTMALLDALQKGRLTDINPVLDLSLKDGFTYPEADGILGTSDRATTRILESLAEEDILLKQPFEKLLLSAEGSPQIMPVERCPQCDSSDLAKGKVLEHFTCGYVGLEDDFKVGLKYSCPKCKRELKLIGTDYRSPGVRYRCRHCKEMSPTPAIKWRSLKSGKSYAFDELQEVWLHSYRFNKAKKGWLEFQLEPKAQLVDFLKRRGYEVEELAKITGRSGATHTLDILATRDDSIVKHAIAMGIFAAKPGEEDVAVDKLFDFDTKAYDIGIYDKVIVAIPKLNTEAKKFAERQRIRVFDAQDFRTLALGLPPPVPAAKIEPQAPLEKAAPKLSKSDPGAKIIELLQRHDYEVTENAKVKGRSGAEYTIDIYAQRNDAIVTQTIATAISHAKDGREVGMNEISQFDTWTYDAGIHHKVFIATPKLSPEAQQFAQHQRIKVFEAKDLDSLFRL